MRTSRFVLLIFCVVAGLGVVSWRAKTRAETARAIARSEARARGASLELQLGQVSTAAEVLGALARQGRGGLTNFQRVATELLTAHPGLASLELQPGGVVSDVVPRVGHERTVGFNVLKDAGQRVGANEAIARRILTVAGPVTLDQGEQGIVARVPVFQRTLDGRDSFWGFVTVSMRLQQALSQAQMNDLVRQGYNFAFFAPLPGQQKAVAIASHGLSSIQDTFQQPVRTQNLEFSLALKPLGGWIDKTKIVLESLAVLLISAFVALLVNLLESRRAVEAELTEVTQRLTREASDRSQAEVACHGAKEKMATAQAHLKQTQLALKQAEATAAQFQARLDASDRKRDETAQAHRAELKEAHAALQKAQETITQLQVRLDAAARAEKDAVSVAQKRLQQHQTTMAELQVRLETATRSTRDTAEASVARVAELERSNRELKARLLVAERAEARVTEVNELLEKAREELRHRQETSTESAEETFAGADDAMPLETAGTCSRRKLSAESSEEGSPGPPVPVGEDASARVKEEKSSALPTEHSPSGSTELPTSRSAPSPSTNDANLPRPLGSMEPSVEAVSPAEPSVAHKAAKAAKRKNARRDDQLHLFGKEISADPAAHHRVHEEDWFQLTQRSNELRTQQRDCPSAIIHAIFCLGLQPVIVMANIPSRARTARQALAVTTALMAMFALCGNVTAAFYVNCAGCHPVPQNGMGILNFQTTTNLGEGLYKVFKLSPGQTAVIQLNVTNGYGGNYALNINNLDAGGLNNSSDRLAYTADPAWSSYFSGTTTNFFMAGPTSTSPDLWTFKLVVKTNTPADFYKVKSQMAGYDSASQMWSQQESFYVQVVAAVPPVLMLRAPQRSGNSFSVQVATNSGFTYYLEYKTDLTATSWNATAQTPGDGTSKTLTDTTANDSRRFYQVRVQ